MLTLHGRANATETTKLLWATDELGISCRVMELDGRAAEGMPETELHRDLPVLQDGGFSVRGGNTILRYLCATIPNGSSFYPDAAQERATIDAWLDLMQSEMAAPAGDVLRTMSALPPTAEQARLLQVALDKWTALWVAMEPLLARQRFLASGRPTIADFAVGPYLHQWFSLDIPDRPILPHVRNYYDLLLSRPAYRRHIGTATFVAPLLPAPEVAPRKRVVARRDWFRYDPEADVLLRNLAASSPAPVAAEALAAD